MKEFNFNAVKVRDENNKFMGLPAIAGESAYQIAVRLGTFTGTEKEWNNYIKTERDTAIKNIQDKAAEILATIPDDYKTLQDKVDHGLDNDGIKEKAGAATKEWLDAHPEATTTVTDGSITEAKLNDTLKLYTIKDYVTPEMFGAKGDRTTDDSEAFSKCIEYAKNNKLNVVACKEYLINSQIKIDGFLYTDIKINSILYKGTNAAILITNCSRCSFEFKVITAVNGTCIKYFSDSNKNNKVSYTYLKFDYLYSKDKCIFIEIGNSDGYCNENIIFGGWFSSGEYAIYADAKTRQEIQFKAYNVGFEGTNTGVYLNGSSNCCFICPRYAENVSTVLLESIGAKYITWIGADKFYSKRLKLSDNTTGSIFAPISEDYGDIVSYSAILKNGLIIANKSTSYMNTLGKNVDLSIETNYLIKSPSYFLCPTSTTKIKLNKAYGILNGINNIILDLRDQETFEILDHEDNIIFNNIKSCKNSKIRLQWFESAGWICEKLTNITLKQ